MKLLILIKLKGNILIYNPTNKKKRQSDGNCGMNLPGKGFNLIYMVQQQNKL